MPCIGDTKKGIEIGRKGRNKYTWVACHSCGKERWVFIKNNQPDSNFCANCAQQQSAPIRGLKYRGSNNGWWKGGVTIDKQGYRMIKCYPDSFYHPMANASNYIREHRLVMAQSLGRNLQPFELVHHKNGVKDDNRLENLELTGSTGEHSREHSKGYLDGYRKGLQDGRLKQIQELKARIVELEAT